MGATVTWRCACHLCACVAEVAGPRVVCGNCASGHHHNLTTP
jgi:hypothetical protein